MEHIPTAANSVADLLGTYGRRGRDPNIDNTKLYVFYASLSILKHVLDTDVMGSISSRLVPLLYD